MNVYLSDLAIINALGSGKQAVLERLLQGDQSGMKPAGPFLTGRSGYVGRVDEALPPMPQSLAEFDCRNNRLLIAGAAQIERGIDELKAAYGPGRIAVLIGTSTSGIAEGEAAVRELAATGEMPRRFHYRQQEIGSPAEFLSRYLGLDGPRYTISTACSSSARVFASGRRLLMADLCDAVIVGGCDTLCELTVNGFDSLESMSPGICNPFSASRDGINIGEGVALFILARDEAAVRVLGIGESSDAYHMSAPEPEGRGAEIAIRAALDDAGISPDDVGYINLHGTATTRNDEMESRVVNRVFGPDTPCSSTKSQTGHTLGAAGAQETGLCWLLLDDMNDDSKLPRHLWDGQTDAGLAAVGLTGGGSVLERPVLMSNSFAFGGSNVSILLGRQ